MGGGFFRGGLRVRAGSRSKTRSQSQKSTCKDLRRNGQSPAITSEAAYTPTPKRAGSRSGLKRVHQPRNLHIRTLSAMAKPGPSRSRPLMLRFLSGLVHALAT